MTFVKYVLIIFIVSLLGEYMIGSFLAWDLNPAKWLVFQEIGFSSDNLIYTTDYSSMRCNIVVLLVISIIISAVSNIPGSKKKVKKDNHED